MKTWREEMVEAEPPLPAGHFRLMSLKAKALRREELALDRLDRIVELLEGSAAEPEASSPSPGRSPYDAGRRFRVGR